MNTAVSPSFTRPTPDEGHGAPADMTVLLMLSRLLEQLEARPLGADAAQYRIVAERLTQALAQSPAHPLLQALLDAYPVASEIYENLNYRVAGLCRSPLEASMDAELEARDMIERVQGLARASR